MAIKYYANRVQETSTSIGAGNLVLGGAPLGYRTFVAGVGADNRFTYYIYRQDTNFEWEIGVGYILSSGGVNQLVRERIVTSSNSNFAVGFTSGTKYVETILSEDRANTSFVNVEEKGANFSPPYIPATYIVDASTANIQVSLPAVSAEDDPIVLGFVLNKTIGSAYEQPYAIQLVPSGLETVAGATGVDVSILNDYLQIVSVPSQSGWILLDPIQDSTNPYGNEGTVQFKSNGAFSGVVEFVWDTGSNSLLLGGSGLASADVVIPISSGQTTIINQNLYDNDFRVAGSGISHLIFADGGLGRVGINSSSVPDTLSINASTGSGITVSKSGTGPVVLLNNTSDSGVTTNNIVGSIAFEGLNNSGTVIRYGTINSIIESNVDTTEFSKLSVETINNGAIEEIAVFSPSGITLGSNTQNIDGIVLGAGSNNEGNNIVAGYYNNVCGENCVVLGDNIVISSGSFGGAIGSDHAVSGTNIWVIGGSGISVTGVNKTILALDEDNYAEIGSSGSFKYVTLTDDDTTFSIENISVLTSGVDQNIAFSFYNTSGVVKTGLLITSSIADVTNATEDSSFVAKILSSGSQINILDLNATKLVVGYNTSSGNNIIFGLNNTISNNNNIVYGSDIVATGADNILIGNNIELMASGTGITVIGQDNTCLSSGNLGIVLLGNGNEANEDYSIAIGTDNANSGLYSTSCGYMNGAHGDYSVSIGQSNLVLSNYSVAIGRNNSLSNTDLAASLFALGVGNSGSISNTGVIVGYLNELYGSGSIIVGNNCSVSGDNNIVIGDSISYSGIDTVLISGVSAKIFGTTVSISGSTSANINGATISVSGSSTTITGSSSGVLQSNNGHKFVVTPNQSYVYGPSGVYVSGSTIAVTGTSINLNSSTNAQIAAGASNTINVYTTGVVTNGSAILDSVDASNYEKITSTGIDIIGSTVYSAASNNDYIKIANTGLNLYSVSKIDSYVGLSNYQEITATGVNIRGSVFTAGYDSDHLISIGPGSSTFKDILNVYVEVDSNKRLYINPSETLLSSDSKVTTYYSSNTKTELQSAGYDISAFSGVRLYTDSNFSSLYNITTFDSSGVVINKYDSSWAQPYYNTVFNSTGVYIYNDSGSNYSSNPVTVVFASGRAGFKQPDPVYTVDISGELRVSNTGVGIIYENYPSATGVGESLVIEDDIIKVGNGGVNVGVFSGSSMTLYSYSKKTQFLDPGSAGTYTLTLDTANMTEGREFYIRNTSDNPNTEEIDVVDGYSSSVIYTIGGTTHSNLCCHVVFDGTQWRFLMAGE